MARQKITPDPTCLLEAHEVTMKFTRYDVGVNSLKELVVRAFRRDLKRENRIRHPQADFRLGALQRAHLSPAAAWRGL